MNGAKSTPNAGRKGVAGTKEGGVLVHEVNEVYIYIPTELSAAGFELKIAGSVKIKDSDKASMVRINWNPTLCCGLRYQWKVTILIVQ